ncbi:low molecular weight protein-tyrosine-phosphatase [Olsenella urininfantis]|uniref:low molecular weight protein-tyrosine-phosphatase n=1 Tax=Olsenella urininfantis TaxID=1871033 RepID=UPI0009867ABF|nr:low molecular weight protein-tyrosine-phosphatase [Olsenella urininfantis]
MTSILFICHGNICRSTMAQYVMEQLARGAGREVEFLIDSAATSREEIGNDVHPGTRRKLQAEGVPCGHHRARQVTPADYERFDHLVIMDEENRRGLKRILGSDPEHKVSKLLSWAGVEADVADPWYTGDFDATYRDVRRGCMALLERLP